MGDYTPDLQMSENVGARLILLGYSYIGTSSTRRFVAPVARVVSPAASVTVAAPAVLVVAVVRPAHCCCSIYFVAFILAFLASRGVSEQAECRLLGDVISSATVSALLRDAPFTTRSLCGDLRRDSRGRTIISARQEEHV